MKKVKTLEELVKKYLEGKSTLGRPDTYDTFKHKNGLLGSKSYSDAAAKLYATSKRNSSTFGANNRNINNKGLQNSGYSAYIDSLTKKSLDSNLDSIQSDYIDSTTKSRQSYQSYLEKYRDKLERTKRSVMSHLVWSYIVDGSVGWVKRKFFASCQCFTHTLVACITGSIDSSCYINGISSL